MMARKWVENGEKGKEFTIWLILGQFEQRETNQTDKERDFGQKYTRKVFNKFLEKRNIFSRTFWWRRKAIGEFVQKVIKLSHM